MQQVFRIAVLAQLAVDRRGNGERRGIGDLVLGDDARSHRGEAVERLAEIPLVVLGLKIACGDVVHHGVAEDAGRNVALADVFAVAADDDGELCFVVEAGHELRVGGDEVVRAACLICALAEIGRLLAVEQKGLAVELGAFVGVRGVVYAEADDVLLGMGNRRADADGGQAQRMAVERGLGIRDALLFGRGDVTDEVGHIAVRKAEITHITDEARKAGKLYADALYAVTIIKGIQFHSVHAPGGGFYLSVS